MTIAPFSAPPNTAPIHAPTPGGAPINPVRLAPFGLYTRHILAGYLRSLMMIAAVLLAIAETIDLWPQIDMVMASGSAPAWRNIVYFTTLRIPGLLAPLIPFATFLAVCLVEIAQTRSGERLFIANTGRSPLKSLFPAVLLGLLLGPATFVMDGYLGPVSMAEQMRQKTGRDAQRLDRTKPSNPVWMQTPQGVLSASIAFGPPASLRTLLLFRFDAASLLTEIDKADAAIRVPETGLWQLENPQVWHDARPADTRAARPMPPEQTRLIPTPPYAITLTLDPLWLSVYGMEAQYLPLATLQSLASHTQNGYDAAPYRTRMAMLLATLILPGAMAMLASTLCATRLAYGASAIATGGVIAWGYAAHAATRACLLLGQTGTLPAWLAATLVPGTLLVSVVLIHWRGERGR
ncbi:LptF/LptG family permease [Acetobacter sp. TBRC 12305]|uniref:LptF/LptG family permease n=1 Tax=Acetobacter garciniae TaxID=2817435 RepID=A0A939HQ28_9PROT|nr:LptF/LptG family permease [Acetobacter garciniae]MBO1325792.1 LptF/LptG family permease [Acetobacter garciniae]MBX0345692.1 LptF/LptG family permease [Acetobacter garciniae]